jgi:hypothetical protein
MQLDNGAIYRQPNDTTPSFFVRVSGVEDGHVVCAPQFGGFQMRIPVDEFERRFIVVPQKELQAMARTFVTEHFDFDDWDATIPGWSNLSRWNGWGCPHFEREVLEEAINDGRLGNADFSALRIVDDGVVALQAQSGTLPADLDWDTIIDKLKAGDEIYEYEIAPGVLVDGEFFPMTVIEADGRLIETYPLGAGSWCWNTYSEPRVEGSPSP